MAGRAPDKPLLIGAVDVNIARQGVGIVALKPVEREDARENEISPAAGPRPAPGVFSRAKNRPEGSRAADFTRNAKATDGGFQAALLRADSELGGRNGKFRDGFPPVKDMQHLRRHIHNDGTAPRFLVRLGVRR